MKQEDKDLLLKDLCARLPYSVKILVQSWDEREMEYTDRVDTLYSVNGDDYINTTNEDYDFCVEDIKPCLFPMSKMTREQLYEIRGILGNDCEIENDFIRIINSDRNTLSYQEINAVFNYCYKHNLDINGLIPKGLAIDCTDLNIY